MSKAQLAFTVIVVAHVSISAQSRPIEVSFEYIKNEVLIDVMVDGKGPFTMMLDTGTDPSAIDLATADAIGIRRSGKGQAANGGGTDKNPAFACKLKNVSIGGLQVPSIDAAAIDLSKVSARLGRHLDGVLGHSLVRKRIVQFDYPHSVVRFFDEAPAAPSGATTLKFRYADNVLIDDVWINGVRVVGNLDTGSNGTFSLTPPATTRLRLIEEAAKSPVSTSVGYNGQSESRVGTLKSIKVGDVELRDATVTYWSAGSGYDKRRWDVNIGNQFFQNYVVTFDYQKKTVTFAKP